MHGFQNFKKKFCTETDVSSSSLFGVVNRGHLLNLDHEVRICKTLRVCCFHRTSVSVQSKKETSNKSWSRWYMNGTAGHSPLAASKPVENSCCEETAPQKSLPAWRTAWWCWGPFWAAGEETIHLFLGLRTTIAKSNWLKVLLSIYFMFNTFVLILTFGTAWVILVLFHYSLWNACEIINWI